MNKEYEKMGTIRGARYAIKLSKRVEGIPGFAPEFRIEEIGDVVVKFLDGEEPYFQSFNDMPILTIANVEEILDLMKKGFVEEDFS